MIEMPFFVQRAGYANYLKNLRQAKSDLLINVFGCRLMSNHEHLMLAPNDDVDNISRLMKFLAARQACSPSDEQWQIAAPPTSTSCSS